MIKFQFQAVLERLPGSDYAASTMTVGNTYTVLGYAGCCWEVTNDIAGDLVIINPCWFKSVG